jgi:hypothetical protein
MTLPTVPQATSAIVIAAMLLTVMVRPPATLSSR